MATKTVTITITDDTDEEGDEDLTLVLVRPEQTDALHPNIRLGTATATVTIAANDATDATLRALAVTDGTDSIGHLAPAFSAGTTEYRAGVGFDTTSVTLSATTAHAGARVRVAGGPTQDMTSTRPVSLRVGDNASGVLVTAENGVDAQTYTVTVTRAPQVTSLTLSGSDPATAYETTATYDVVFRGRWNRQVTPSGVPGGAHFTSLIGGVHSDEATFVVSGGTATEGIEQMAETGGIDLLEAEVQAEIDADPSTARSVVTRRGNIGPTATAALDEVEFNSEFPRLTLTSMIAPTPDWFVGVSGLLLLDDQGRWLRSHHVDLYPWDAGTETDVATDNGFSLGGENIEDHEPIRSLRGAGPFTIQRIGSLRLTLNSVATTRDFDENAPAGTPIGAPVNSPVAPPPGTGTVTYALAGADAGSFEINATSGQLSTKSGVDYDYEARAGAAYELTVVATDTGPDPAVVTNIDVTILLNNIDEAGTLTVAPATAGVNVLLTASVTDPDGGVTGETRMWERSDNGISGWSQISGATAATYTPVAADETKYLRVTVGYDDAQGTGRSLSQVLGPVEASMALSSDRTLNALSLSGLTLSPTFNSTATAYTAGAGYTAVVTTATATAAADGASVQIAPADADSMTDGHQVLLGIGDTEIVVKVTAEDGTSQNYTVTVTRAQPTVTVGAPTSTLTEGDAVPFTISRSEAAGDALAVKVSISEDGEVVASSNEKEHTVTIPAGDASVQLEIASVADEAWEAHSTVTAAIQTDSSYTVGTAGEATQTVADNDFADADAALSVIGAVDEDAGTATATVTVTTARDEAPHEGSGPILLTTATGTAGSSDFTALTATTGTVEFDAADFVAGDGNNGCPTGRYCTSTGIDIAITDDALAEGAETFTVAMARVHPQDPVEARTDSAITLDAATTPQTVTINASDRSDDSTLSRLALDGTVLAATQDGNYTATVEFADEQVTVAATADATASVTFLDAVAMALDDASSAPGHQVDLVIGETVFKVLVTAQDTTETAYTVTVTRSGPVLTVSVTTGELTEGDSVVFTVTRDGATSDVTDFELTVSETGGPMATGGLSAQPLSLSIGSGETSATHTVTTVGDDGWEPHAMITAAATSRFSFTGGVSTLAKQVLDDDFPAAEAALAMSPARIAERPGAVVTVTLTLTTGAEQQPHKASGTIRLATVAGTATAADYVAISQADGAVSFDAGDFALVDIGSGVMRWQASETLTIGIVDDTAKEPEEQFSVTMALVTTGSDPTDPHINLHTSTEATVTIDQSDLSSDASLRDLGLSQGSPDTAFTPGTTDYDVTVPYQHPRITISPTAANPDAQSVEVLDGSDPNDLDPAAVDDDPNTPGAQVDLALGTARAIAVRVTAEDGSTRVYRLAINRELPELTVSIADDALTEGGNVVATISRNAATGEATTFTVTVSETAEMVADTLETVGASHVIQPGQTDFELVIPTLDDGVWDAASTVSVELLENDSAYSTSGPLTVTSEVSDNDFPEATAAVTVSSGTVDESQPVTATVTITTARLEQPNEDTGRLLVSTSDGPDPDGAGTGRPATAGADYRTLTAATGLVTFRQGDFIEGDGNNGCPAATYCAGKEIEIATIDDAEPEPVERFTVSLEAVTADPDPTDANIEIAATAGSRTVDIAPSDLTDVAGLRALGLTGGQLDPVFVSTTTSYTASIGFDHPQTTISPETQDPRETVAFLDADNNDLADAGTVPGFQVDLPVGTDVVVNIVVTAQDGISTETYTVTLTRQPPEAAISVGDATGLQEGGELTFTVTLNGPAEDTGGLDVTLAVSETGGTMLPPPGQQARTVTVNVAQGQTTATHTVATVVDDDWEQHSTIEVSITAAPGSYTAVPGADTAGHLVLDDDFPEATAVLGVSPNPVDEGGTVTAMVVITTARDEQPREDAGTITVSTSDGTATAGSDYTAIGAAAGTFTYRLADFERVDIDTNPTDTITDYRWRAVEATTLPVTNDTAEEPDETFTVAMATVDIGSSPTDSSITPDSATTTVTATINANDVHRVSRVVVHRPGETEATATVDITNPSGATVTVLLRYRQSGGTYGQAVQIDTNRARVQFDLAGLSPGTLYEVEASLDSGFGSDQTSTTRFSTIGSTPTVSDIEVEKVDQTGASVTVFIANVGTTTARRTALGGPRAFVAQTRQVDEHTVHLRYRQHNDQTWEEQEETTTESSVTFHLTGLPAGSEPEVEATLSNSFDDVGVQSVQFATLPPAVTAVEADDADIAPTTAEITVTVSDRNGDSVHLRYRPAGGHWTQTSRIFDDNSGDTFTLTGLTPCTAYDTESSYDSTFTDRAASRRTRFTTATDPDATACISPRQHTTPGGGAPPGGSGGAPPGGSGGGASEPETEQPALKASDVPEDAWYHNSVQHIARLGVTTGYPDGTYRPSLYITRAQMAAFLSRALGGPSGPTGEPRFSDVPEDAWYYPYVQHIASLGVAVGCKDGTRYCPRQPVARSQMALFLYRAFDPEDAKVDEPSFDDIAPDHYAFEAIEALYAAGITTGCGTEPLRYCGIGHVTRAQMAAFLSRAITHAQDRDDPDG